MTPAAEESLFFSDSFPPSTIDHEVLHPPSQTLSTNQYSVPEYTPLQFINGTLFVDIKTDGVKVFPNYLELARAIGLLTGNSPICLKIADWAMPTLNRDDFMKQSGFEYFRPYITLLGSSIFRWKSLDIDAGIVSWFMSIDPNTLFGGTTGTPSGVLLENLCIREFGWGGKEPVTRFLSRIWNPEFSNNLRAFKIIYNIEFSREFSGKTHLHTDIPIFQLTRLEFQKLAFFSDDIQLLLSHGTNLETFICAVGSQDGFKQQLIKCPNLRNLVLEPDRTMGKEKERPACTTNIFGILSRLFAPHLKDLRLCHGTFWDGNAFSKIFRNVPLSSRVFIETFHLICWDLTSADAENVLVQSWSVKSLIIDSPSVGILTDEILDRMSSVYRVGWGPPQLAPKVKMLGVRDVCLQGSTPGKFGDIIHSRFMECSLSETAIFLSDEGLALHEDDQAKLLDLKARGMNFYYTS